MAKDDLLLLRSALKEAKYQFDIYLEGFNDLKQKNQILLVVCSLFITVPLSSEKLLNLILVSDSFVFALFIAGQVILVLCIISMIWSMRATPVYILNLGGLINFIGTYNERQALKAIVKNYRDNLVKNIELRIQQQNLISHTEKFIKAGILTIFISITWVIIMATI